LVLHSINLSIRRVVALSSLGIFSRTRSATHQRRFPAKPDYHHRRGIELTILQQKGLPLLFDFLVIPGESVGCLGILARDVTDDSI
jgi:hypothetical protein